VYNTLPVLRQCLEKAITTSGKDTEILLVNNHPPYQDVQEYLSKITQPRVKVLDPGTNLGCHLGVHFGFAKAEGQYLVKLDDDILVPDNDWLSAMRQALIEFPNLAYVSLPWPPIKTGINKRVTRQEWELEFFSSRIYSSCMMIKAELWRQHFTTQQPKALYATIEGDYSKISKGLGMTRGYLVSHPARHLGRSPETDPLFGVWKVLYAKGLTREDFSLWKQNFTMMEIEYQFLKKWGYPEAQLNRIKDHLTKN
jgi:glycosyltransferase involved in cell wall biosynthesis